MLNRRHWPLEALAELVDGALVADQVAEITAHAAKCRTCADNLEWLRRITTAARRNELVDPPTWVTQRGQRLFAQIARDEAPDLVEKLVAFLAFDSRAMAPAPGVRGGPVTHRRLLYSAGDYDVDLQVQPGQSKSERTLQGQVMSRRAAGGQHCEVELFRGPERVVGRRTAPAGEFSFDRLRPGSYGLRVRIGRKEIEVGEMKL